ncbi:hypothetical protein NPIL_659401 [Nephila pilipes]|uniref:Uncharacterized protein n=1 Tax=Nephila pilipes TaxID=299642 RepID=A0A8X6K3E9_NEPPI|nr:hypothetical protein NPIL_659401 [Nephila pilipes]
MMGVSATEFVKCYNIFEDHIMEAGSYLGDHYNPGTYEEVVNAKDSIKRKKAMKNEMRSLKENPTWKTDLRVTVEQCPVSRFID